jgi:hypothetical protein
VDAAIRRVCRKETAFFEGKIFTNARALGRDYPYAPAHYSPGLPHMKNARLSILEIAGELRPAAGRFWRSSAVDRSFAIRGEGSPAMRRDALHRADQACALGNILR